MPTDATMTTTDGPLTVVDASELAPEGMIPDASPKPADGSEIIEEVIETPEALAAKAAEERRSLVEEIRAEIESERLEQARLDSDERQAKKSPEIALQQIRTLKEANKTLRAEAVRRTGVFQKLLDTELASLSENERAFIQESASDNPEALLSVLANARKHGMIRVVETEDAPAPRRPAPQRTRAGVGDPPRSRPTTLAEARKGFSRGMQAARQGTKKRR